LGVAAFLWLTSASCGYYGVFTWIMLGAAIPYEMLRSGAFRMPHRIVALGVALSISALAYLPLALPYIRLGEEFGFHRPLDRLEQGSARPSSYLRSRSSFHQWLGLEPARAERMLFPGLTALLLGGAGLLELDGKKSLYVLLGVVAAWASLGPSAGLYGWLHRFVPGVSGLRVPARFAIFVFLALAVLAGAGAGGLVRRLRDRSRVLSAVTLAILPILPLLETIGTPLQFRQAPVEPPEAYRWLAAQPAPSPIVEFPFPRARNRTHGNTLYMLWSTVHFRPMANGHSALVPPSYFQLASALQDFPTPSGVAELRRRGIRYIILHRDLYLRHVADRMEERLDRTPEVVRVFRGENESIYELSRQ